MEYATKLNSTSAGYIVLVSSVLAKAYMSCYFRVSMLFAGSSKKVAEMEMDPKYKWAHRTQLNDAEWAPLSCAALFFLASKGIEARLGSTLLAFSSVLFTWARFTLKTKYLIAPLGATIRYIAILMIAKEIYDIM